MDGRGVAVSGRCLVLDARDGDGGLPGYGGLDCRGMGLYGRYSVPFVRVQLEG